MQRSSQIITTSKSSLIFLQAGCPSCHPNNSVKVLKGKVSHSSDLFIPSSHAGSSSSQLPLQEGCQVFSLLMPKILLLAATFGRLLSNLPVLLQTLYCRIMTMKNCNTVKNLSVGVYIAFSHNASLSLFVFFLSLHFNGHFPGEPGLAGVY